MDTHFQEDCWCNPYILNYRVQFHKDEDGHYIGSDECYDMMMKDFEEYLKECLLDMRIDEVANE